jgi:hypothetical protein
MTIRAEVQQLIDLGQFPASADATEPDLDRRGALLTAITPPLSREEGAALLACFGPDEAFGLAWTLLHLVESTEGGVPIVTKPKPSDNEWVQLLWDRSHR